MSQSLFRKQALEKMESPEELHDYICVTTPRVWLIFGVFFLLLLGVVIWSVCGEIPTSIATKGYLQGDEVICYLTPSQAQKVKKGTEVSIDEKTGTVENVSEHPLSRAEVKEKLTDDYTASMLTAGKWNVGVLIKMSGGKGTSEEVGMKDVKITIDSVRPISFAIN